MTDTSVAQMPLEPGKELTFARDPNPWTVQAVSAHFAAATRLTTVQEHDQAAWLADPEDEHWKNPYTPGETLYTVLDWRNGVRGPCNLIGQAYNCGGFYTKADCAAMLAEFEAGTLEVSHRNQVRIEFGEVAW